MNKQVRMKLSPPWCEYYSQLKAMFGEDPDINLEIDGDNNNPIINMRVKSVDKATALSLLIPEEKEFGNIIVYVNIIPPNNKYSGFKLDNLVPVYEAAFKNNPVLSFIHKLEGIYGFNAIYVVFKNKVVQYFNDNLNDIYGNTSTLYEDIARDIFEYSDRFKNGVFFCTDVVDNKLKNVNWP